MANAYPVVGIQSSGIQTRLEIRDLKKNATQFSLFIRALNNILDMRNFEDQSSLNYINKPNSWWQIAALAGVPFMSWSGDPNGPQEPAPSSDWGGYCHHSSVLFPAWHRIFVLLAEQAIVNEAIEIGTKLDKEYSVPQDRSWSKEATKLRLPFWDWTSLEVADEGIPLILQLPQIEISNPDGTYAEVNNPLNHYRFTFRPGSMKGLEYMGNWSRTYRWVDDIYQPTKERYTRAHEAFSKGLTLQLPENQGSLKIDSIESLRKKVASLFDYPLTLTNPDSSYNPNVWGLFATTGMTTSPGSGPDGLYIPPDVSIVFGNAPPNLEEPHNKVHNGIGGIGTMSTVEFAAFDPIFFLHHCNVDRIYALWEYVYPNYTIGSGWKDEQGNVHKFKVGKGTFPHGQDVMVDHTTPLVPFRTGVVSNPYWTSDDAASLLNDAQTHKQKYYTYPAIPVPGSDNEVIKVDVPYDVSDTELRNKYRQTLYNLFGQSLPDTVASIQKFAESAPTPLNPQLYTHVFKEEETIEHLRSFIVLGEVPEFAFPGSYHLQLYLRPEVTWDSKPLVIGSTSVFGRANPEKCAACIDRQAAGSKIRGYMPLNHLIIVYLIELFTYNPERLLDVLHLPPPQGELDLDFLVDLIKSSLGAELVRPDGSPLASPHLDTSSHVVLDEAKVPRLTLHSNRIEFNIESLDHVPYIPIEYEGAARDHGEIKLPQEGATKNHGEIKVKWRVAQGLRL